MPTEHISSTFIYTILHILHFFIILITICQLGRSFLAEICQSPPSLMIYCQFVFTQKKNQLLTGSFLRIYYIAYFFIIMIPPASTTKIIPANIIYVFALPVLIDNSTSAISISSSPSTLLFGVESLSGTPFSL